MHWRAANYSTKSARSLINSASIGFDIAGLLFLITILSPPHAACLSIIGSLLPLLVFIGPFASDKNENGVYIIIVQDIPESRHHRSVFGITHGGCCTVFYNLKKLIICMMPGMAAAIMWRRRQHAVGVCLLPIRLPLKLSAMTGGTVGNIDFLTVAYLLRVFFCQLVEYTITTRIDYWFRCQQFHQLAMRLAQLGAYPRFGSQYR